jgi:hypothetical protein
MEQTTRPGNCPCPDGEADFEIGGGWGDAIDWSGKEQFDKQPLNSDQTFACHGWKSTHPKVGQTLKGEFVKSWMIFEFTEIEPCGDPADMFFAKVRPIRQILKPTA